MEKLTRLFVLLSIVYFILMALTVEAKSIGVF